MQNGVLINWNDAQLRDSRNIERKANHIETKSSIGIISAQACSTNIKISSSFAGNLITLLGCWPHFNFNFLILIVILISFDRILLNILIKTALIMSISKMHCLSWQTLLITSTKWKENMSIQFEFKKSKVCSIIGK